MVMLLRSYTALACSTEQRREVHARTVGVSRQGSDDHTQLTTDKNKRRHKLPNRDEVDHADCVQPGQDIMSMIAFPAKGIEIQAAR